MAGRVALRLLPGVFAFLALFFYLAHAAHAEKACADVNKNGSVDSIDAVIILQVDAGLYDPGLILLNMWDPSGDDEISSLDALLVLQHDAGLIEALEGCYAQPPTPLPI
jgi:hypothetical protein